MRRTTTAQRRVMETDGIQLLGYDERNRPVVQGETGIPKQIRVWALLASGDPADVTGRVTPPVEPTS
jgi:hypothetical protein